MRLLRSFVLPLTSLLLACGGSVADVPSNGAPHDVAPSDMQGGSAAGTATGGGTSGTGSSGGVTVGPKAVIGQLIALTESAADHHVYQRFDIDLQAVPTPEGMCDRATATVGSCCSFPPVMRPPTLPPGEGTATPVPATSAGTVTFADATTSSTIGTFDYQDVGYAHAPANYDGQVWRPGDELRVTATGAQVGAFTVSAPSLLLPAPQVPAQFTQGQDLAITWQPDANADTLLISILDGGSGVSVACSASDAAGAVTVSGTLLAKLAPSTRLQGVAESWAARYAQTATGRLAFKTTAWSIFETTMN